MLNVSRCQAYYDVHYGKFEPKYRKGVFVGYKSMATCFQVWLSSKGWVIVCRDIVKVGERPITSGVLFEGVVL